MVQKAAQAARMVAGNTQVLSDGSSVDASELIFQSLEALPGEMRVPYGQTGQNLSTEAGGGDDQQYAEIVSNLLGQQAK